MTEGVWEGRYNCSQGPVGFSVEVASGSKGRVRFYPLPENPGAPEGEYEIEILQRSFIEIELRPVRWIRQPPGYNFVRMRGAAAPGSKRLSGRVEAGGCADFVLTKVEKSNPPSGAAPNIAKKVEPQSPPGAPSTSGPAPKITENVPSKTTSRKHALSGPDDFAAIGLTGKMTATEVFALFNSDKQNGISWRKTGIDAKCQGVAVTAEDIRPGQPTTADRRAFKLVLHQEFDIYNAAGTSGCSIRYIGDVLQSVSCYGPDRREGNNTVLESFRQRVGDADSTVTAGSGMSAEWRCSSAATQPPCKVVVEASEAFCIVAGSKTACPQYKVNFERDARPEQDKINKEQALLRGGCVPEAGQGTADGSNRQFAQNSPRASPAVGAAPEAFKRCIACHSLDASKKSLGPHLLGIIGRRAGSAGRGSRSEVSVAMDQGIIWNEEKLSALLSGSPPFGQRAPHVVRNNPAAIKEIVEFLKTK